MSGECPAGADDLGRPTLLTWINQISLGLKPATSRIGEPGRLRPSGRGLVSSTDAESGSRIPVAACIVSALTVLVVQGGIALVAWLLGTGLDAASIAAISAAGGVLLMGTGLRLLAIRQIAVADMLPALLFAPLFVGIAAAIRGWLGG